MYTRKFNNTAVPENYGGTAMREPPPEQGPAESPPVREEIPPPYTVQEPKEPHQARKETEETAAKADKTCDCESTASDGNEPINGDFLLVLLAFFLLQGDEGENELLIALLLLLLHK